PRMGLTPAPATTATRRKENPMTHGWG
ncbi:MAG: hypothetical protein QOJ73_5613, partial [Streptosporangiaceae bacterium]|nr:hypothetical protein [Streptosporangiaceae bacterium]